MQQEDQHDTLLGGKKNPPSFLSQLFFYQFFPLLKQANMIPLENDMIDDLSEQECSFELYNKFKRQFQKYQGQKQSLYKALFAAFRVAFIINYTMIFAYNILLMYVPVLINQCLTYLQSDDKTVLEGCFWIGIIFVVRISSTVLIQQAQFRLRKMANDQYTAVSVYIMQKTLNVSFLSNKSYKAGEIITLMQVDCQRILTLNLSLAQAIFIPVQLTITIYLLFNYIGISFLSGFGVLILIMCFNFFMGRIGWRRQKQVMKAKDARTKFATELFQAIKFIKVNALENYFKQKLSSLRDIEIGWIRKRMYVACYFVLSLHLSPQLILNATLATYILMGESLTPANTFSIISLFAILQGTVTQLPSQINTIIEANVSIKRIQKYFMTNELMDQCIKQEGEALSIKNGTFYWGKDNTDDNKEDNKENRKDQVKKQKESKIKQVQINPVEDDIDEQQTLLPTLQDINLEMNRGEFIVVIGDVGTGKSSLVQAIVGEMLYNDLQDNPQITVSSRLAYVSQKSWIQNATLQNNILFGLPFNENKYKEAIEYSCLKQDIAILDKGDQTMIGEKGVNLSGGQKARISLARAIYSNSDIYLFDDPISAVDVHVGKFIIEECIHKYLKGKTILLITHALQTLQYADKIVLMDNGTIIQQGTMEEIRNNEQFDRIYQKFFKQEEEDEEAAEQAEQLVQNQLILKKKQSSISKEVVKDQVDDLMLLEERKKGEVSLAVFKEYFKMNGGWSFFFLGITITALQAVGRYGAQLWLAYWSTQKDLSETENEHYLEIFSFFSLTIGIFAMLRVLTVTIESIKTANEIHKMMIDALLLAPICQFFERIPIGVLMNRQTKDQAVLDMEIFWTISLLYINVFNVIANTFMNIYSSTYYIILPVILFFYLAYRLQRFYMACNRELYRLESISKSPILSYFCETVHGLSIIRAFGKQSQFLNQHCSNIDLNRKIQLNQMGISIWFSIHLQFLSYIVNMSALIYTFFFGSQDPAAAGILMTIATNIDVSLQNLIYNLGSAETQFISFERCLAFTKVHPEQGIAITNEAQNWPNNGNININELVVKYRENLSPALKGLNVHINSEEKIGVVGRTGAGKSTITLSLLRILEASQGNIIIDDVDISTISLHQLRQSITMILQDAVLFEGSLRENLDPQQLYTEQQILQVAQICCLQSILETRQGLDTEIHEGGDNLSAGEKQLIGIARAVLKKSKIILIDEATANIDIDTEQKIQQTIKSAFQQCTVITIAHRINTIMHSDKILVIDGGQAKEFDSPQNLLQDSNSIFYSLYQEALKQKKKKM